MVPENKHRVFVFGGKNPPCIGYVNKPISVSFSLGWAPPDSRWGGSGFPLFLQPPPSRGAGAFHVFIGGGMAVRNGPEIPGLKPGYCWWAIRTAVFRV